MPQETIPQTNDLWNPVSNAAGDPTTSPQDQGGVNEYGEPVAHSSGGLDPQYITLLMWGGIALMVVLVAIMGYFILGRNQNQMTPDEERQLNRTYTQQYQQYWGAGGPRGARGR